MYCIQGQTNAEIFYLEVGLNQYWVKVKCNKVTITFSVYTMVKVNSS